MVVCSNALQRVGSCAKARDYQHFFRWLKRCWLCLLLVSCGPAGARTEGYRELALWLEANALPDERVAVQEPGAWKRLTGLPLVSLLAPESQQSNARTEQRRGGAAQGA